MPTKTTTNRQKIWVGNITQTGLSRTPPDSWVLRNLDSSVTHDGPVRDWKRRIALGQDATTNLSGYRLSIDRGNCLRRIHIKYRLLSNGVVYERTNWNDMYCSNVPGLPGTDVTTPAENAAATKAYRRIAEIVRQVQGGTILGELSETLRMIKSPAKALREGVDDYLRDAKKHAKGSPRQAQRRIAGTYLEYAFGWAPLVKDLDDVANYFNRRKKYLAQQNVRFFASGKAEKAIVTHRQNSAGIGTWTNQTRERQEVSVRYMGAVAHSNLTGWSGGMKSIGLTLSDFVPTAWELLPYSFLIDYFSNIGDVLEAYSLRKTKLAWCCRTERKSNSVDTIAPGWYPPAPVEMLAFSDSPAAGVATHTSVKRTPITHIQVPEISFEVPGIGRKWLNIAALAAARR